MPIPVFPSLIDDRGGLGGTADRLCATEGLLHRPPTGPIPTDGPASFATPPRPAWTTITCQHCGAALAANKIMCTGCGVAQQ